MENIQNDLKQRCRACLNVGNEMICLQTISEESTTLLEMFKDVTNLQFIEGCDEYPPDICVDCKQNVLNSFKFKRKCFESYRIMKETLEQLKGDEIEADRETDVKPILKKEDDGSEEDNKNELENCNDNIENDDEPASEESSISESETENKQTYPIRPSKKRKMKKRVKSQKFDTKSVLEAIAEFRENHKNKYQKTCMFCQLETVSYIALATHIANFHKEYKGKWCFMCNQLVDDLDEHRRNHAEEEEVVCKFCSRSAKPSGYVSHLKTHLASKPFICTYCQRGFMRMDSLKTHLKAHANEKPNLDERPHKCRNCGAAFTDLTSLGWHVTKHGPFKCNGCLKRFKYKKRLNEHQCSRDETEIKFRKRDSDVDTIQSLVDLIPTEEKVSLPNFCHPCNRKVKDLLMHSQLYHSNSMDQTNEFQCFVCKKSFDVKSKLRNHFRTHEEKLYSCKQCNKKFKSPSQLRLHEHIHTTDRPFVCNVCGKAFGRGSTLKTHMIGHSEKPEVCELCGKRFCRPAELKLHMTKHAGIKPYLCPECGKSFSQKSHLTEHSKSHSEERPHQCPYCEKAFKSKSILTGHIKIHKGDKAFKCMVCGYGAYTQFRLSQHILRQHEKFDGSMNAQGTIHTCVICKMTFPKIYKLNVHMASAHKVVVKTAKNCNSLNS